MYSNIFRNFSQKEDLFNAALSEWQRELKETIDKLIRPMYGRCNSFIKT